MQAASIASDPTSALSATMASVKRCRDANGAGSFRGPRPPSSPTRAVRPHALDSPSSMHPWMPIRSPLTWTAGHTTCIFDIPTCMYVVSWMAIKIRDAMLRGCERCSSSRQIIDEANLPSQVGSAAPLLVGHTRKVYPPRTSQTKST